MLAQTWSDAVSDQAVSFNAVAAIYAAVRPGYPEALFDDLEGMAALTSSTRVLEVGCGSGQATAALAQRARSVLAVDPGEALVAHAKATLTAPKLELRVSRFEDLPVAAGSVDLVASAQAWHWVAPDVACARAAEWLAPGGRLAIFGHVPLPAQDPLRSRFQKAFEQFAPELWDKPPPQAAYLPTGPFTPMLVDSGLFGPVIHRAYSWIWTMTAAVFGQYLRTDSSYLILPEAMRFDLFDALAQAVGDEGGVFEAPWETHLYVARKA